MVYDARIERGACMIHSAVWCLVHTGDYQLDLASDDDSCILIQSFTVNCTDGYSQQGDSKVCSEQCQKGQKVHKLLYLL